MSFVRSATYPSLRLIILMSLKVLREREISIVVGYFRRTDLYQLYIQLPLPPHILIVRLSHKFGAKQKQKSPPPPQNPKETRF